MTHLKKDNSKIINYTTPIIDNSSISIDMKLNSQDEIERCYIDFRTHKSNGKINGLYILRITPQKQHDKLKLKFISRKGNKQEDLKEEKELLSTTIEESLTLELIDELIRKIILIINNKARSYKKQSISLENENIIQNINNSQIQAINFIKQIKGEIPLPHLEEILEKFIDDNSKNKNDNKKKILK